MAKGSCYNQGDDGLAAAGSEEEKEEEEKAVGVSENRASQEGIIISHVV